MSPPAPGHVLFLESNTTGTGRLALERLLERGHTVTFATRKPELYPFLRDPRPGLDVATLETNDAAASRTWVQALHGQRPLLALLTFSEYYVPLAARLAAELELPYLSPQVATTCRAKHLTRQALKNAGLPTPEFHLAGNEEEARRIAAGMRYPCVVKPVAESSSQGVLQVEGPEQLLAHFRRLHAQRRNARGQELGGEVLIESLLAGPEFSVETFTLAPGDTRCLGVVAKHLSPPPLFVELGHDFPADLPATKAAELESATVTALDAVGYNFGPAHTELRYTPAGPVVVEINPRLAGGMIPELVRYARGVDLLGAFLDLLTGQPVDLEVRCREFAAIRFLTASRRGMLAGAQGLEAARALPSIREASLEKALGIPVQPAQGATDRLGHVIAAGPLRASVLADLDTAMKGIEVEVETPVESGATALHAV